MEDTIEKLKPCPFCGKLPEILERSGFRNDFYIIRCNNEKCPASCVSVMNKSLAEAVDRWNARKK